MAFTQTLTSGDVFANLFRQQAPQLYGLHYGGDTPEWFQLFPPSEASSGSGFSPEVVFEKLGPYMEMSGAELEENWSSLPADIRETLGQTPQIFAQSAGYQRQTDGSWSNTFQEKGEGLGDLILPALIAGVGGLGLGMWGPGALSAGTAVAGATAGGLAEGAFPGVVDMFAPAAAGATTAAASGLAEEAFLGEDLAALGLESGFPVIGSAAPTATVAAPSAFVGEDLAAAGLESGFPAVEGTTVAGPLTINPLTGLPDEQLPAPVDSLTPGQLPGTTATTETAISKILNGTATTADWLTVLGQAAPGLISAFASGEQADSLSALAQQYAQYGAPSRARFEASMTPGFDVTSIPGYSGAVDTSMETLLRKLSATSGNPFGNPGGLIEANKAVIAGTALPAVSEYQRLNLAGGGLASLNAAVPGFDLSSIGAESNIWKSFGDVAGSVFNPPTTLEQLFKQLEPFFKTKLQNTQSSLT